MTKDYEDLVYYFSTCMYVSKRYLFTTCKVSLNEKTKNQPESTKVQSNEPQALK